MIHVASTRVILLGCCELDAIVFYTISFFPLHSRQFLILVWVLPRSYIKYWANALHVLAFREGSLLVELY